MGRLEDIVERNKNPRRFRARRAGLTLGVGLSIFVFIVIVLMVFTDLGVPPQESPPPHDDTRVHDIKLYRVPAARDAAAD